MPVLFFIVGLLLLIVNLFFMLHWIAVGSLLALVSFVGAVAAVSIIVNSTRNL